MTKGRYDEMLAMLATHPNPRSDDVVELMVRLWRETLDDQEIGPEDNFFVRGGHSLLAARMLARISAGTGREFDLVSILRAPTPAEFASVVVAAVRTGDHD